MVVNRLNLHLRLVRNLGAKLHDASSCQADRLCQAVGWAADHTESSYSAIAKLLSLGADQIMIWHHPPNKKSVRA